MSDAANENSDDDYRVNNEKTATSKSFEYKTKLIGSTPDNNSRLDAEVVVSLRYLSNFWRSLNLSLINCEIEINLTWSIYCVISEISRTAAVAVNLGANSPVLARAATETLVKRFK